MIKKFIFVLLFSRFLMPSALSDTSELSRNIDAAHKQHAKLEKDASVLLLRLVAARRKFLEDMKENVLEQITAWEENPEYLNGRGLKATLIYAYEIAEEKGLDVPRLKKLLESSKKLIRGLEYNIACGKPSTTLGQMANGVAGSSDIGNQTMKYYGLVQLEEERVACVTERRLITYRAMYRNYIKALVTPEAQKSDPNGDRGDGFKEASKGFRDFANTLVKVAGVEADLLAQEARNIAEDQDNALLVFEVVPVVGELMDIYKLTTGENVLGTQADTFDKAATAAFLFTPKILTVWLKRNPGGIAAMRETLNAFKWGYFDAPYINGVGKNIGHTAWNSLDSMKKWADDSLKKIDEAVKKNPPGNSVNAVKRPKVPGEHPFVALRESLQEGGIISVKKFAYQSMADTANMMPEHVMALSKNAVDRQEVYLVRHLSELALEGYKKAYKAATNAQALLKRIATKPMSVKPKSSNFALLQGGIPVDQYLSKTYQGMIKETGEAAAKLEADIIEKNKFMNGYFKDVVDEAGNKTQTWVEALVPPRGAPLDQMDKYPFRRTIAQFDGQEVLWKMEDGVKVLGVSKEGKLWDPITKTFVSDSLDDVITVELLSSVDNIKVLPDFDLMGVFSKARGMEPTWNSAGEFVDYVTTGTLGSIDRIALDAMTAINASVKKMTKVMGDVIHHGPAHFFSAPPDFPLDVFLPDGSFFQILAGPAGNPDKHLKAFYHSQIRQGMKMPKPPAAWGWPPYDPFTGYRGQGQ